MAMFQKAMDVILAAVKCRYAMVYIHDVIIFTSVPENHIQRVQNVLKLVQKAGMSLQLNKCHFPQTQ